MPASLKIFTMPVRVDGKDIIDIRYAHGDSMAGIISLALSNREVIYEMEALGKDTETVEYIPTSYINIITKDIAE